MIDDIRDDPDMPGMAPEAVPPSLRLLVVAHNYPRFPGDAAGAFVARLAAGAASRGHDVRAIAPHAPGLAERSTEEGVSLERVRYAPDPLERAAYRGDLHRLGPARPLVALGTPLLLAAMRRSVTRSIAERRVDVIHAHWWIPGGLVASGAGSPLVITSHGSDVRLLSRSSLARRLASRVLRSASIVTAVSHFLAEDIERSIPTLRRPVRVTPMPVDTDLFARGESVPKADPPRILYAGNLLPTKGVQTLIEAVALLVRREIPVRLRILGEGPMERQLRVLAERQSIAPYLEWSPFRPQHEMPAEYGASTVVVLPTHGNEEGLGLTLVEALLAGTAVIGTRAGGIPEVVHHERTGLLVRGGDHRELASSIERLIRDAELRRRLIATGREHARATYALDSCVDRFLAIYDAARRT